MATVRCPYCGAVWVPRVPRPVMCPRCRRYFGRRRPDVRGRIREAVCPRCGHRWAPRVERPTRGRPAEGRRMRKKARGGMRDEVQVRELRVRLRGAGEGQMPQVRLKRP